jgi:hypothetical protein
METTEHRERPGALFGFHLMFSFGGVNECGVV